MVRHVLAVIAVSAAVSVVACGGGPPLPQTPSIAGGATGVACGPRDEHCAPLVVDQPQDVRTDLGVVMSSGVAVYACDGHAIRLLRDCHVDGSYRFIRLPRDVQSQQIKTADEVAVNLPALAAALGAKISAAYQNGAALDVAWEIVGRKRTTWQTVTHEDLLGGDACAGATHFVRGVDVGAFSVKTGRHGVARAAAEIFRAGGDATTSRSEDIENHGGMDEACAEFDKADSTAEVPVNCTAAVRLELAAIGGQPPPTDPKDPKDSKAPKTPDVTDPSCPPGYVSADGLCVHAADQQRPHECEPGDLADCDQQCKRGNGPSCTNAGVLYVNGKGAGRDPARAVQLFEAGCKSGDASGCFDLGLEQYNGRASGERDVVSAARSFKLACDHGHAGACAWLSVLYDDGSLPRDINLAARYAERSCDGGDKVGCTRLAFMLDNGTGVKQDLARAVKLEKLACDGGEPVACNNFGYALESGRVLQRDVVEASRFYARACRLGEGMACLNLGTLFEAGVDAGGGRSVPRDDERARQLYEEAYERDLKVVAGAVLRVVYHQKREIPADELKQTITWEIESCKGGSPKNCGVLGFLLAVIGQPEEGERAIARGCQLGDPWSCFEMKRVWGKR